MPFFRDTTATILHTCKQHCKRRKTCSSPLISIHVTNDAIAAKHVPIHDSAVYAGTRSWKFVFPSPPTLIFILVNSMRTQCVRFFASSINYRISLYILYALLIFILFLRYLFTLICEIAVHL